MGWGWSGGCGVLDVGIRDRNVAEIGWLYVFIWRKFWWLI